MVLLVVLGFVAALLLGALAGAWVVFRQYGARLRETDADFDGVSRRLGEVTSALAAAEAENRLLTGHNERLSAQRHACLAGVPAGHAEGRRIHLAAGRADGQREGALRTLAPALRTAGNHGGHSVDQVVTEIGSGLNGHRARYTKLLKDPSVGTIIVEHRDRAARFGVEHLEAALSAQNRTLAVVDEGELQDDLVRDMTDVLTSFCARLYGRRGAKARAKAALRTAETAAPAEEPAQ
jgi:putative resolvase